MLCIWYDHLYIYMYLLVIDSLINELILWLIEFFTYSSLDLLVILVVLFHQYSFTHWLLIYKILVQDVQLIHVHFYFLVFCTYILSIYLLENQIVRELPRNTSTLELPRNKDRLVASWSSTAPELNANFSSGVLAEKPGKTWALLIGYKYGLFTYIRKKNDHIQTGNVGKYSLHGSFGHWIISL